MPIDEDVITQKLHLLEDTINVANNKTKNLERLRIRLEKIKTIEILDPNDATKRIQKPPMDEGLKTQMTPARRQELYDAIITEVNLELA